METILKASGIRKNYGERDAVKGIDFNLSRGECFGFLGPNGAGKTTTMKMIYGLIRIDGGELKIFGLDARREMRRIKSRLGVVPQEENLDPDLTTLKNLELFARYFRIPPRAAKARADDAISFMQLNEHANTKINTLSGGMKRRLLLARALLNEPELLILDEPTTGLDPQARHLIWQKLRALKENGTSMILTTHYMDEAAQLCDRLVIMDHGRIIAHGKPDELVAKNLPGEVIEVRLYNKKESEIREIVSSARSGIVFEKSGDTLFIFTDASAGIIEALNSVKGGIYLKRQSNLEDLFLKLTGRELRE
ncbi:MAG: ATP-binding cassette domain-containing protein [Deltaproteobacteria bacterium]|nr:ATP-binding cassette domain-containing protein [Deltaproteobacteria bacterium]